MDLSEALSMAGPESVQSDSDGMLFVVRVEPDPFTGERLNVGVFGVDRKGRRRARVIESVGRLECLYGDDADAVLWLARAAKEAALAGLDAPSPQLSFDGPSHFFNASLDEAIDRAFEELVTVALPSRERHVEAKLTDEDALRVVSNEVKQLIGLSFDLLVESPSVVLNTDRGPWTVRIPLQPRRGAGTIRSADYTPAVLKAHLTDSILDLECAARYRSKPHLGLFLLRPKVRGESAQQAIDSVIDSVTHRAPSSLRFEVSDSPSQLAHSIVDWAQVANS